MHWSSMAVGYLIDCRFGLPPEDHQRCLLKCWRSVMPYYNLQVVADRRILSAAANNREHAIAIFGEELGVSLTLEDQDIPPPYLLDEWHHGPHWVNPTIPVYKRLD